MTVLAELRRAQEQIDSAIRHFDVANFEDAAVYLHAARATLRNIGATLDRQKKPLRRFAVVRAPATTPEEIESRFLSPQPDGCGTCAAESDEEMPDAG